MRPSSDTSLGPAYVRLAETLATEARTHGRGFVVGLSGPQGSGKSTLAAMLAQRWAGEGLSCAVLSLDDVYLTRAEREARATAAHPLFRTRGPPGTHDVGLAERTLEALSGGGPVALPRFDKGRDDRRPESEWPVVRAPVDVVLFEGWCLGVEPSPIGEPLNALERERDADGGWRTAVEATIAGDYQALWGRVHRWVRLRPPGFEVVLGWRREAERALHAARPGAGMSDAELGVFVQHYERWTRRLAEAAPRPGEIVIDLDAERAPTWVAP